MSQGLLIELFQEEARSRRWVLQTWRETRPARITPADVAALVQLCLRTPEERRVLWERSFRQLVEGEIREIHRFRGELSEVFESELAFLELVQGLAGSSELAGAIESVVRL